MGPLTVVCCLFKPRNKAKAGSAGWGLYNPSWVTRLMRGFRRHYSGDFKMLCLSDFPESAFAKDVEVVAFERDDHLGTWMSITEVFRPDLFIERGVFCGLDTIICGPMDDILSYDGTVAMTRDATGHARVSNAMVLFDGGSMIHLWERYCDNPKHWEATCQSHWTEGMGSEMIYWRDYCDHHIDVLDEHYPARFYDHTAMRGRIPKSASVVYFRGANKPSRLSLDDPLRQEWEKA